MTESSPLRATVVISTRNRPERVATLLAALGRQSLALDQFEVVIVDNGSTPPLDDDARAHRDGLPGGLRVRILRNPNPGSAAAGRNFGWRAAKAPLVAFTDDDCRPSEAWISAIVKRADTNPGAVIQGRTDADPNDRPQGPFDHTMVVHGPSKLFETCNVAYERSLLERLAGFDESYMHTGEDVDLGWRALQAGAELVYADEAQVYHAIVPVSFRHQLRRTFHWIEGVRALKAYPHLRILLVHRLFWKASHPPLIILFAGCVAALRFRAPSLAAVALLPCLYHRRNEIRGKGLHGVMLFAKHFPRHLAIDAAEIATVLAGSIRYRTLML